MGVEDLNRHFPKEEIQWPKLHEKVLNFTDHQGNANQGHNEISITSYLLEWLSSK